LGVGALGLGFGLGVGGWGFGDWGLGLDLPGFGALIRSYSKNKIICCFYPQLLNISLRKLESADKLAYSKIMLNFTELIKIHRALNGTFPSTIQNKRK
jgi:hypothetical protein